MPTVNRTGKKHMLALTDILASLMDFDPGSDASMSLWLSRFVEQAATKLSLPGGVLFSASGTDIEIVAKHGISDVAAYQIIDLIRLFRECTAGEAESPEVQPEMNRRPDVNTVLAEDGLHYTFTQTRLIDGRLLWLF